MWNDDDPYYDVRDRFVWLTPMEIAKLCYDFARQLRRKNVTRNPAERLELALNAAAILTRVAERITGSPYDGSYTPERDCVRMVLSSANRFSNKFKTKLRARGIVRSIAPPSLC